MAAASIAARGKAALDNNDYERAITEYTSAIKEAPTSPDFYNQRSTANLRAGHFKEALSDAEHAVLNAQKRAKRELIIDSQFRRAIALYKLEQYADADFLLKVVKKMKPDHKQCDMWIQKSALEMKKIPESDERRQVKVTETPNPTVDGSVDGGKSASNGTSSVAKPSDTASPAAASQTPAEKIRWDWYQNTENVYFTLLAKGAPKEKTHVEITERTLSISFPLASGSSYDLTLEPLFSSVTPEKCTTRVLPSKIEIILVKAVAGHKWAKFESDEPIASEATKDDPISRAVFQDASSKAPAYPTSSKSGPKDWDQISKDLRKAESGKANGEDDDLDDDYGGDEGNKFFKMLFKNADPDTQRAMMKSYQESNGTALSTNWEEVSKKKYETLPPDGMEAKSWNQ